MSEHYAKPLKELVERLAAEAEAVEREIVRERILSQRADTASLLNRSRYIRPAYASWEARRQLYLIESGRPDECSRPPRKPMARETDVRQEKQA